MNAKLHRVLVAIPVLALAACASSGGMASKASPHHNPSRQVTDAEYMALVERKALSRGVDVHWVQPPLKRVVASDD